MPKDEFDFDDPMELSGMALLTNEDTTAEMAECFIEEFMRMGFGADQILALFRNPHYLGPNMVLEQRGEPFVRGLIAENFACWGRPVAAGILPAVEPGFQPGGNAFDKAKPQARSSAGAVACAEPGGKMPASTVGNSTPSTKTSQ